MAVRDARCPSAIYYDCGGMEKAENRRRKDGERRFSNKTKRSCIKSRQRGLHVASVRQLLFVTVREIGKLPEAGGVDVRKALWH
jgi:hypothetical protein